MCIYRRRKSFLRVLLFFFLVSLWAGFSYARSQPLIHSVVIKGNEKVERDAIFARIQLRKGTRFNRRKVREDIQSLFETGYFYDVKVLRERRGKRVRLIYKVLEKPSVAEIVFKGHSEIDREELLEITGLKVYDILNMTQLQEAAEKIEKEYEDKGYFLASVKLRVEAMSKEKTVRAVYDIVENSKIEVKKITILGNRHISDSKIKEVMETQEGTYFGFLSGAGAYKKEAFERDTQRLRYLYLLDGYVQVKFDRPEVYVTPNKKDIYITIRIEEGEQFFPGEVEFSGDLLFDSEELSELIKINKSKVFSYQILQEDIARLTAKYGDLGYAFTNVIPKTSLSQEAHKVDVTFEIDKGSKVYFGRIDVIGNTKTRDKVIRRELKIAEGELYNETFKRVSLANIKRLGFFEEVHLKTTTPAGQPEILNIEVEVKERNTGTINVGAGYGSTSGLKFQAQVNQINFLGRGQNLGVTVNSNVESSTYNLNFTEPYFLDTKWSLGTDIYKTETRRQSLDYQKKTLGGALRFGHPLSGNLFSEVRLKVDETELISNDDLDEDLYPINDPGQQGQTNSVTLTLVYDKRNDRFTPSHGYYARSSLEYAGLGGDLTYTLGRGTFRYYKKLFWKVIWRNNLSYSFINSSRSEVPFSRRFLLGGPFNLKGYDYAQVGQRRFSNKFFNARLEAIRQAEEREPTAEEIEKVRIASFRPFGGEQELYYNMEFEWPLIEEARIKGILFYDIGAAEDSIRASDFLSDWGVGVRWFSPIGPLRFELGFPLNRDPNYHREKVFNFTIGTPF